MKYIIYCRKSSEAEDRQVLSIDSQFNELTRLAERENLVIDKVFKESMTAKQPGRPIFENMMNYIEKKKGTALLVWKLDRLARNAFDGGRISWFMDRGLIIEIKTPEKMFKNISDDKFMMSLDFGIAKKYVDDLSVNVKRGNRAKLEKGGWPGFAPIGYLNNKLDKTVVIDKERFRFVQRVYELYAKGGYSLKETANVLYDEGFRTLGGKKVFKSVIHHILSNPFYYGVMERHGKYYQGNYEPIVSKELFDKVNEVLSGKNRSRKKQHFFTFRGFMTCEKCGCLLTATEKKGHNYYYCTNGKGKCDEHKKYLRSEKIELLVADVFSKIQFDEELVEIAYSAYKEKCKKKIDYSENARESLLKQASLIKNKKDKLLDCYLAETVSKGVFELKMTALDNELVSLKAQIKNLKSETGEGQSTLELTKKVFLDANLAKKRFLNSDETNKRKVVENLLWNLSISNQKIANFKFKMPYQILARAPQIRDFSIMLPGSDSNRRPIGYTYPLVS